MKNLKFCLIIIAILLFLPEFAFGAKADAPANINLFQSIGLIINNIISYFEKTLNLSRKLKDLQALIGILITMSIMYKGYMTLAGKAQDPIRDLVWDIARKLMIMTFVFNLQSWLSQANSALKGFYEWAGGTNFWVKLDEITINFLKTCASIWNSHDGFDAIIACFILFFMIVGFLAVIVSFAFSIVAVTLTNTFLIIALPLALFCFMYENTRQVFVQWCNMFLSNIFLLLFLFAFASFIAEKIGVLYADEKVVKTNFILAIIQPLLISACLITCINVIKTLASNLAQVSLDTAAQSGLSSAISQPAGKLLGGARKGMANFGLGMLSGSGDKAEKRGGLSAMAGFQTKKVGAFLGKKLLSALRKL